jgi:hypothetical protein
MAGFEPTKLESIAKHANSYTSETTNLEVKGTSAAVNIHHSRSCRNIIYIYIYMCVCVYIYIYIYIYII